MPWDFDLNETKEEAEARIAKANRDAILNSNRTNDEINNAYRSDPDRMRKSVNGGLWGFFFGGNSHSVVDPKEAAKVKMDRERQQRKENAASTNKSEPAKKDKEFKPKSNNNELRLYDGYMLSPTEIEFIEREKAKDSKPEVKEVKQDKPKRSNKDKGYIGNDGMYHLYDED